MKKFMNEKGTKLGLGIAFGCVIGFMTSNMQLWLVLGISIGAAFEYGNKKTKKG